MPTVLLVDDEPNIARMLAAWSVTFERRGMIESVAPPTRRSLTRVSVRSTIRPSSVIRTVIALPRIRRAVAASERPLCGT